MVKPAFGPDDDALLAALGVPRKDTETPDRTPEEERIIAGFEEICRFVDHTYRGNNPGRAPVSAPDRDVFERIYATRLHRIRSSDECRALVRDRDRHGLLDTGVSGASDGSDLSDDELLAALGVGPDGDLPADLEGEGLEGSGEAAADDITVLRHVRSQAEKQAARNAADEIANRTPCADFDQFSPRFEAVRRDLERGARTAQPLRRAAGITKADIRPGVFFILGGQIALIEDIGEIFLAPNDTTDARLRVIYDNGTESNLLLRSMQRALHKDETSRMISELGTAGPLFSEEAGHAGSASGIIYIARSQSKDPAIRDYLASLHKIGVTGGDVEKRIANAAHDPTFLLAPVEIVATYELFNINRVKLESLLHKFFGAARLDLRIRDRFAQPVSPREWFLVPLPAINEAVEKIRAGTIGDYSYDVGKAKLVKQDSR